MPILKKSSRALIVGGLFFILPVFIIIIVVAKTIKFLAPLGHFISKTFNLQSVFGTAAVTIVCLLTLLLICLVSGLLIEKGFVRKWSNSFEEKLFLHFPSLQMLKFRLIGDKHEVVHDFWQAIVFEDDGCYSIAFITEETKTFLTIYFPDAPKIDTGEIRYFTREKCQYFKISMKEAMSAFYNFGKGLDIEALRSKQVH